MFFFNSRYNMSTDVFLIYYISTVPVQCVIVKKINKYGCLVQLIKTSLFLLSLNSFSQTELLLFVCISVSIGSVVSV